jgi:sterol desaturase/sphingolipid hydroxylase (fatty acid hydroxylase superfamily)
MPQLPDIITWAIPAFVLLIIVELLLARTTGRADYEAADTLASLMMGLGNSISNALLGGLVISFAIWLYQYRLFDIGYGWWAWALCFVLDDFFYYVFHRTSHRCRWFWASHVIHHSSQHYNLSTALRQTWTGKISFAFMFNMPLVLIGFPPAMLFFCGAVNLIYQFWIHTEAIGRMPRWFEALFNTPSHHRVHHATNADYLDANYAGMFIIWDRMFGSFVPERADLPCRYGLVHNLITFNPLRIAFHEWIAIARDIWRSRRMSDAFGYLFGPPGWSPDGSRETTAMIKARHRAAAERS